MAALDTRTVGCFRSGSGLVVVPGNGVGVGVVNPGRGCAGVAPAALLGPGVGVAGTKAMGFRSPVVGVAVVVFGRGAIVGDITLGLIVVVCCRVVLMALLVLARSFRSMSTKVRAVVMVRCWGAGCLGIVLVRVTLLPLALDSSVLAVVSSSMASITHA